MSLCNADAPEYTHLGPEGGGGVFVWDAELENKQTQFGSYELTRCYHVVLSG